MRCAISFLVLVWTVYVMGDIVPVPTTHTFNHLSFPRTDDETQQIDVMLQHETGIPTLREVYQSMPPSSLHSPTEFHPFTEFIRPESVDLVNGTYYKAFPYITGEGFKLICDHIQEIGNLGYFPPRRFLWSAVTNRSLVYWPLVFISNSIHILRLNLRKNNKHIFLMAHNQDASYLPSWLLDDPHVLKVFVVNCQRTVPHPKVIALPLGIRAYGRQYPLQLNQARILAAQRPPTRLVHVRLGMSSITQQITAKGEHRLEIINQLRSKGIPIDSNVTEHRPFKLYALDMAPHRFVLSPRGIGMDAHRTWEGFYVGRVPIVENILPTMIYKDLPVLVVTRRWNMITPHSLQVIWDRMLNRTYNTNKLWMPWWVRAILCECLLTP